MSSDFNSQLVSFLSASESRSGEAIAAQLGCSRTAVWKHVESLRNLGIEIDAVAGRGYQLREPLELLDENRIRSGLSARSASLLTDLVLLSLTDSTNNYLQALPAGGQAGTAVLAECQSAGRGRRGQQWVSPFGRNIYLSLGWTFEAGAGELACLPLLVALSASDALHDAGLEGHGIKWPNDLLLENRKLGGCLVEVQGDVSGPCHAVMGVGINVRMSSEALGKHVIDQPWTDVASHLGGVSRNGLAAGLLNAMLLNLEQYALEGFDPFMVRWKAHDLLAGHEIELNHSGSSVRGISKGITARGALILQSPEGVGEYTAGEISMVRKGIHD